MTGEMPLKKRLIDRDGLYARNFIIGLEADDPINHQKGIAMRQDLHYLVSVETATAGGDRAWRRHRASSGLLAGESASQLRIRRVAGFHRHHMTANRPADQRQIADNVQNFVPHKFVGEAQRFFAQDRLPAHHNRIFKTAALDQIFLHERLNIFVENKCSGRSYLALKNCRRNFHR